MFKGIYTALITPFKNGFIDKESFVHLIERQIKAGIGGIVICGTTGESPTINHQEHNYLIDLAVKTANKKIKIIAGTGSNSTEEAIATTKHAEHSGADAALIVTPYYNKPNQEGIYQNFLAIHNATNIPIILYNIPGRCIVDISVPLLKKLSLLPRIVGVKDATGDLSLPSQVKKATGDDFVQLSGDDATLLPFYASGGHGSISVTTNIVPELYIKMSQEFLQGNLTNALKIQNDLLDLNKVLFCESNPTPVKYALSLMGLCDSELRLPLVLPSKENQLLIKKELKKLNLI